MTKLSMAPEKCFSQFRLPLESSSSKHGGHAIKRNASHMSFLAVPCPSSRWLERERSVVRCYQRCIFLWILFLSFLASVRVSWSKAIVTYFITSQEKLRSFSGRTYPSHVATFERSGNLWAGIFLARRIQIVSCEKNQKHEARTPKTNDMFHSFR